jgi:hypothetical protein
MTEAMSKLEGMKFGSKALYQQETISPIFPGMSQIRMIEPVRKNNSYSDYKDFLRLARAYNVVVEKLQFKDYKEKNLTFANTNLTDVEQSLQAVRTLKHTLEQNANYYDNIMKSSGSNIIKIIDVIENIVRGFLVSLGTGLGASLADKPGAIAGANIGAYASELFFDTVLRQCRLLICLINLTFSYCKAIYSIGRSVITETLNFTHALVWNYGWQE